MQQNTNERKKIRLEKQSIRDKLNNSRMLKEHDELKYFLYSLTLIDKI
jgi:hypothetical protein